MLENKHNIEGRLENRELKILTAIRESKEFQAKEFNKLQIVHAVYLNTSDISEAKELINKMLDLI